MNYRSTSPHLSSKSSHPSSGLPWWRSTCSKCRPWARTRPERSFWVRSVFISIGVSTGKVWDLGWTSQICLCLLWKKTVLLIDLTHCPRWLKYSHRCLRDRKRGERLIIFQGSIQISSLWTCGLSPHRLQSYVLWHFHYNHIMSARALDCKADTSHWWTGLKTRSINAFWLPQQPVMHHGSVSRCGGV